MDQGRTTLTGSGALTESGAASGGLQGSNDPCVDPSVDCRRVCVVAFRDIVELCTTAVGRQRSHVIDEYHTILYHSVCTLHFIEPMLCENEIKSKGG